ncbi:hypothetical protein EMIT079MI2_180086 [Bacillus sp. IT-79MI2]
MLSSSKPLLRAIIKKIEVHPNHKGIKWKTVSQIRDTVFTII